MKKIVSILLAMMLSLAACDSVSSGERSSAPPVSEYSTPAPITCAPGEGSAPEQSEEPSAEQKGAADTEAPNILIAYFTWADNTVVEDEKAAVQSALSHYESMGDRDNYNGVDAVASASVAPPGNTAQMAGWIQQEVGGDLHSIVVQDLYPSDYDECLERAADEKAQDARPVLSSHVGDMEDYNIVFLGFPNWWYTLPMPVLTFVEEHDWSGKTVVPFVTHGTGGLSATVRDLTTALPDDVAVMEPIGIYRPDVPHARPIIQEWLSGLDLEV